MADILGQMRVLIEGQPEQALLSFELETITDIDRQGAPQGSPVFRRMTLTTRVAEGLFDAISWAVNEPKQKHNLRNGKIDFYDKHGKMYQTLEWVNGFVERADWILPDVEKEEEQEVQMCYQIVARKISIGGVELVNDWHSQHA